MFDYHKAMTSESINRQRFEVITPDMFKKDVASREEQRGYSSDVQVWMLPGNPPCQAFPIRHGHHREIVVLPMFTESWFYRAQQTTFVVPHVWEICKILSYTLTGLVRQKGVKFPRLPFVVLLDPNVRLNDGKNMVIYTPDPKIQIPGVRYIQPNTVHSNGEMLNEVRYGEQIGNPLRLVREQPVKGRERWFWEPISYLSIMRLMSISYPENEKPTFTFFGEIDGKMVTMQLHKVAEDFGDTLSRFQHDYLDKEMLVRYAIRPGGFEVWGDAAVIGGALCGPSDDEFVRPENNRIITY